MFSSAESTKLPFVRKGVHKNVWHSTLFVETVVKSVIKGENAKKLKGALGLLALMKKVANGGKNKNMYVLKD